MLSTATICSAHPTAQGVSRRKEGPPHTCLEKVGLHLGLKLPEHVCKLWLKPHIFVHIGAKDGACSATVGINLRCLSVSRTERGSHDPIFTSLGEAEPEQDSWNNYVCRLPEVVLLPGYSAQASIKNAPPSGVTAVASHANGDVGHLALRDRVSAVTEWDSDHRLSQNRGWSSE